MDPYPAPLKACLAELEKLPGIGRRSAQRILFHLLGRGPEAAQALSAAIGQLVSRIERCPDCRSFREADRPCPLCTDPSRNPRVVCVVESPADVLLIESTGEYRGLYHVLHGLLSPLRGVVPEALGLDALERRLAPGEVDEVILATPPTAEGEATASYVAHILQGRALRLTRIGFGLPVGTDLQYADAQTLSRALSGRRELR